MITDPIERARAMISDPGSWPVWPILPLISRSGNLLDWDYCAFLVDGGPEPWRHIYIGLIFKADNFATMPTKDYDCLDALLADYKVD